MNNWINLTALWQILVVGLIAGAGLPALFAIGLRAMSLPGSSRVRTAGAPAAAGAGAAGADGVGATGATGADGADGPAGRPDGIIGGSVPGLVAGAFCFLVVLAAIGWGIFAIYQAGHPK